MQQQTYVPITDRPPIKAPIERAAASGPARNVGDIERLASTLAGGALTVYGLREAPAGLPLALVGGVMLYRGLSGHCPIYRALGMSSTAAAGPVHVTHVMTINVPPGELYAYWRDFSNLPRWMRHLEEVQVIDAKRSHWVARGPAGTRVRWDAEIIMDKPDEMIAWHSLPDAQVTNAGSVRFLPAPGGRGTEVKVVLEYLPPAGALGRAVARVLGEEPAQQVSDDLRRLKMALEAGEIATNAMRPGQPKQEVA